MCRGHGIHVVDLAIRSAPVVIGSAVPTGLSNFGRNRLAIWRDGEFRVIRGLIPRRRIRGFGTSRTALGHGRLDSRRRRHLDSRLLVTSATAQQSQREKANEN